MNDKAVNRMASSAGSGDKPDCPPPITGMETVVPLLSLAHSPYDCKHFG